MSLTLRTTTELVSMFEDRFWFLAVVLGFGCVSFLFTFVLCLSGEILLFRFGCSGPLFCSSWWWWWSFVSGQISSHHLVFYFFCSWFSVTVFLFLGFVCLWLYLFYVFICCFLAVLCSLFQRWLYFFLGVPAIYQLSPTVGHDGRW
jgi:hypothetical protein